MSASPPLFFIGCAGWSIPKVHAGHFAKDGTHLRRYSSRFGAVEINSSFYRPHRATTYVRWASSVPSHFRFAVKMPKEITHIRSLTAPTDALEPFLAEVSGLGDRLGPLLVQLPPSLRFDASVVASFFSSLRELFGGLVVCEPRHASWFQPKADELLRDFFVAKVAADPAIVPIAAEPGGWHGLHYYRLHGSPRKYYSQYSPEFIQALRNKTEQSTVPTWCIFDNTALGAATANAIALCELTQHERRPSIDNVTSPH